MSNRPTGNWEWLGDDYRPSNGVRGPTMRRREMVALSAGALASAVLYACGADKDKATKSAVGGTATRPDCVLTPEQEEGPFYIDLAQVRENIVENRPGARNPANRRERPGRVRDHLSGPVPGADDAHPRQGPYRRTAERRHLLRRSRLAHRPAVHLRSARCESLCARPLQPQYGRDHPTQRGWRLSLPERLKLDPRP